MAKAIPDGFNSVSCYLVVPNSVEALEFYRRAFGAEPRGHMPGPDGKTTMHAEMRVGNSIVMLTDENPMWGMKSPKTLGGTAVSMHLYVEDADAAFERALVAGCTATMPIMDMFWGDRYAKLKDPYGHSWSIATHKEDLTPEQLQERAAAAFAEMGKQGSC